MMATDFALDPATWDIYTVDGDWAMVSGADEVGQRCAVACKTFIGEWAYNVDLGLPWFGEILTKDPNIPRITDRFRTLIAGIDGVTEIQKLELTYNSAPRTLGVDCRINTVYGPTGFVV